MQDLNRGALAEWATAAVPGAAFFSVSGAHLYGFPSRDSDVDVRGCFFAPVRTLIGLKSPAETLEPETVLDGTEVEAVAHEAGKYLKLLLRHNGYVLEQIFSPLVLAGEEFLGRLRPLAARCVTQNCYHHYRGFLATERRMMAKQESLKAKTLLYAYRVALTGIHLLQTGEVQSHLPTLNEKFRLGFLDELIARKAAAEFGTLPDLDPVPHARELDRLERELENSFMTTKLPEHGPAEELSEFLVAERLGREAVERG